MNERFPQFKLREGEGESRVLYQPDFGVLFASKCISAAWRYAQFLGVETRTDFRLSNVVTPSGHNCGERIVLEGRDGADAICTRAAVLAPGAWLSSMASQLLNLRIPTHVSAETVCYYAPRAGTTVDHTFASMPVFIPDERNGLGPFGYYGLPQIDVPGVKCSAHYCGPAVHPDRRPLSAGGTPGVTHAPREDRGDDADAEAAAARVVEAVVRSTSRFMADTFPHLEAEPFVTQSCLYTTTPDHDYVISTVPDTPGVILAGGGSGHAFKMGPAIGRIAASLALASGEGVADGVRQRFDVRRLLGLAGTDLDHELRAPRR
jgi:glycine/D-amino acid oxidase-like deaminating enzyme